MLSMMLPNHVYDGVDSLECAKDQESHRQSSQWTMEWCKCAHVPSWGGLGGVRRKRESYSGTFWEIGTYFFVSPTA